MRFFGASTKKSAVAEAEDTTDRYSQSAADNSQGTRGRSRTNRPKNIESSRYAVKGGESPLKSSRPPKHDGDDNRYNAEGAETTINRVPTAMGYHSDDSGDDLGDEQSRYSRYDIERKEPRPKNALDADEDGGDADDKYSQYAAPVEKSGSADSCPPQWRSWSNDEQDEAILTGEDADPQVDEKVASEFEKPNSPKKTKKENPGDAEQELREAASDDGEIGQVLPAVLSETSSLTDPLEGMVRNRKVNKKAKKSKPNLEAKKQSAKGDVPERSEKSKKGPSKRKSSGGERSKSGERKRSTSRSRKSTGGTEKKKKRSKEERRKSKEARAAKRLEDLDDEKGTEVNERTAISTNGKMDMYNKSLMTDDTDEVEGEYLAGAEVNGEPRPFSSYIDRIKAKRKATPADRARKLAVMELDEYSQTSKPSDYDDPQLVQCLKFYYCGGIANTIETGINVATCKHGIREAKPDEIEALRIMDDNEFPMSPNQKVEVVLEGYKLDGASSMYEGRQDDESVDSILDEAPDIQLPHTKSYVKEVTSVHLKLDEESDLKSTSLDRGRLAAAAGRDMVSITTLEIPTIDFFDDSNESVPSEIGTQTIITPSKKKKKLFRGMFSRFRQGGKKVVTAPTLPTTAETAAEEASEAPIELVAAE
jgi:hypothetical protein